MNILFVNYGDFTSNSLNHIAGFAGALTGLGHHCIVAVPTGRETISVIAQPAFTPALFEELIADSVRFADGRPADIIHAWTPREVVRRFVLAYQPKAHARLVIHLEDNEDFLLSAWLHEPIEAVRQFTEGRLVERSTPGLSHPRRYRQLLRVADGVTHIVAPLKEFIPAGVPALELPPGIEFQLYHPQPADPALRSELGLRPEEKVVVFTGSNTFANEPEIRDLYAAIARLNADGLPTRLVRTGLNSPNFTDTLSAAEKAHVLDLGFVEKSRLPRLLGLADVLVQPGRAGPFNDYRLPSKLPEFLAAGRPVVLPATNLGRELRDGIDALLLHEGTAAEIANACTRLFRDPALARQLGGNAAAFARRRFDLAALGRSLEAFYRSVLDRPLAPGSTGSMSEGASEVSLVLRQLAATTGDRATAELASELAPLVEAIERDDFGRAERARLEREITRWKTQHQLAEQHGRNLATTQARQAAEAAALRKLRDTLQGRVTELDRHLATAKQARDLANRKLARMQESFSWQVTAPLRWLRRTFIDPWQRQSKTPLVDSSRHGGATRTLEGAGIPIWHSVDQPQEWSLNPGSTVVRGWCFAEDGRRFDAIRAVLPDRVVEGEYGQKRLDVFSSTPEQPQAEYCGWRIELPLKTNDTVLNLEARDSDGRWHGFFHTALQVGEGLGVVDLSSYEKWIEVYDTLSPEDLRAQKGEAVAFSSPPLISVLMPVYDAPERWLARAIESVRAQTYPHWELCLADDASPAPHVRPLLEKFAREDPRIKVRFREKNGHISAASNSALELATGTFVALLDHDDELAPHALFEVAGLLGVRPGTDFVYSDEDKIDEEGRRFAPYFKPDFLPDLFLAQNYTTHLSVYRTAVVRAVGGFREGFEGSQDWDLALRVSDRCGPERIAHLPKVLYHWRAIPGSTAQHLGEKDYTVEAGRRALTDHFARKQLAVRLHPVPGGHWRVQYPLPSPPPLVSLIIPTRNGLTFLQRCVDSILSKTTYPAFEVLVIDNGSDDPATLRYLASLADGTHPLLQAGHRARVRRDDGPFNFSALNNRAVHDAKGEVVALLNNDLEIITPDWLEEMVSQAVRPDIGCVGAMLYYPNDMIQHAGVVVGMGGVAGHAFGGFRRGSEGHFNRARLAQNYSAVTAACLVVRKSVYEQVGGLDEQSLAIAFNDVDFCLKVRAAGYRNLWTPFAELYHHESATRGAENDPEKQVRFQRESAVMKQRWGALLESDPAYNPNLTLADHDFALAVPPRAWRP